MSTGDGSSVLAIGIDAAESSLVKQLIEQNEMPALKALLDGGRWLRVQSPAPIGSGAVWPTFITGLEPATHGVYSEWSWKPGVMGLSRYHGRHLTPFWKGQARQNIRIGTFDVPFVLPVGVSEGFEVSEWWAHDSTGAGLQARPNEILSLVKSSPAHPLSANRFVNTTPNSQSDLKALSNACIEGARLRGKLARTLIEQTSPRMALMVFPEIHHASHQMWHTVDPYHRIYNGRRLKVVEPLLRDLYREVDTQIGALIDSRSNGDTILVFALHGMRPASGFPAFLGPLLCERGFSRIANWSSQSWRSRALSLLAETKRHTPEKLKKLYYKLTPTRATHKLARPTMLPQYDWANTSAFSLPTDQYGWIRINLVGREIKGSVPLDQYDDTCEQLKELLLGLVNDDGQPLVRDIVSTPSNAEHVLSNPLPDLVVHWEDAAFAWPLKIRDSKVQVAPVARKSTGQHASEGFCIYRGTDISSGVVAAKDLGCLITQGLSSA
jgi:predicted AlkP superfamily phosphohydrolase/phosphomutase